MSVLLKDILAVEETVNALMAIFSLTGVSGCGIETCEKDRQTRGEKERMVEKLAWDSCTQRKVLMIRIG